MVACGKGQAKGKAAFICKMKEMGKGSIHAKPRDPSPLLAAAAGGMKEATPLPHSTSGDSLIIEPDVIKQVATPVAAVAQAYAGGAASSMAAACMQETLQTNDSLHFVAPATPQGPAPETPVARSQDYWCKMKRFQRRLKENPLPPELAQKYAAHGPCKGELFRLFIASGADAKRGPCNWAQIVLGEDYEHQRKQQVTDEHEFLTEAALRQLPQFGEKSTLEVHMARCRHLGLWRKSPEMPEDSTLDEYWTRVKTRSVDKQSTQQSARLSLTAKVAKETLPGLLQPRGPLGALPQVPGMCGAAQASAWSPQFASGALGEPPTVFGKRGCPTELTKGSKSDEEKQAKKRKGAKPKAKALAAPEEMDAKNIGTEALKFHVMMSGFALKFDLTLKRAASSGLAPACSKALQDLTAAMEAELSDVKELIMTKSEDVTAIRERMHRLITSLNQGKILNTTLNAQLRAQEKLDKTVKAT